jgi:hypothetical protein
MSFLTVVSVGGLFICFYLLPTFIAERRGALRQQGRKGDKSDY